MSRVAVVDYGIGNVFSVCNALKHIGVDPILTRDAKEIRNAGRLILPGVGAFSRAMENLRSLDLDTEIRAYVAAGRPFLGVCIGMQVLLDVSSEFGTHSGLGLIPGSVEKIPSVTTQNAALRVPHVSWAQVKQVSAEDTGGWRKSAFYRPAYYYFVHSYSAQPADPVNLMATTEYGGHQIAAAIRRDNVTGVQFHPERSGPAGLQMLKHFIEADDC